MVFEYDRDVINNSVLVYAGWFWVLNWFIQWICKGMSVINQNKLNQFASNVVSCINVYMYMYMENNHVFFGYYIYDIINSIYKHDMLIIVHHLITMFVISIDPMSPNKTLITKSIWYFETSSVFLHYYKMVHYTHLSKMTKNVVGYYALSSSIVMWIVFRVGYLFYNVPASVGISGFLMFALFSSASIWWINSMRIALIKIKTELFGKAA